MKKNQTRLYKSWADMKTRCKSPNNPRYADYGGDFAAIIKKHNPTFSIV